jgi:AcrR family transcriptional regulator
MIKDIISDQVIAEQMVRLILRKGYNCISLDEITELLGVQQDDVSHYFKNKESILLYVLHRMQNELNQHIFSISDDLSLTESERLVKINQLLKDYFLDQKGCLIAAMGMEKETIGEEAREIMNDILHDWKYTYTKLYSSRHTPYMSDLLATNAIIFIEGAIIWLRVTGEDEPLKRVFKDINEKLGNL